MSDRYAITNWDELEDQLRYQMARAPKVVRKSPNHKTRLRCKCDRRFISYKSAMRVCPECVAEGLSFRGVMHNRMVQP